MPESREFGQMLVHVLTLWVGAFAKDDPNIAYILIDDGGLGDIRIQSGTIPTPWIDALAGFGLIIAQEGSSRHRIADNSMQSTHAAMRKKRPKKNR